MTAQATPKSVSGSGTVFSGPCSFRGFSLREAAGSPGAAVVRVWDNTAASGTMIAAANIAASGGAHHAPGDGIRANIGLYLEVVSGTIEGSVWIG